MPIYRVPEMSSTHNFQNRHNHQPPDDRLRRHDQQQQQQQQQHHHHYHREQPFLDQMQTHYSPNDEVSMRRSHSNPTRMADSMVADVATAGDESIVEREIRLQLEREAEIASLHLDPPNARISRRSQPETRTPPDHPRFRDGPEKAGNEGGNAVVEAAAGNSHARAGAIGGDDDDESRRAAGHFSRAGDSAIARELTEQKKREAELRSRYRNNTGTVRDRVENGKTPEPGSHSSSSSSSFSSSGGVRSGTKVQPLVDPEEEDEEEDEVDFRQIYIKPQMETLIEREVRLLRQREGSLRRVRGYPLPPKEERLTEVGQAPARRPPSTQERGGLHHRHSGEATAGDGGPNLRRLATNRLKQEMLKERQREIDLRRQGKIYTISEERLGLDPSHLAIGSDDGRGQSARGAASDDEGHLHGVGYDVPPPRAVSPVRPPRQQQRRSTDSGEATASMPPWRTSAEMRIEAEVREARRREKELREQRRLLSAAPLTNPQLDQSSEEKNRSVYRRT